MAAFEAIAGYDALHFRRRHIFCAARRCWFGCWWHGRILSLQRHFAAAWADMASATARHTALAFSRSVATRAAYPRLYLRLVSDFLSLLRLSASRTAWLFIGFSPSAAGLFDYFQMPFRWIAFSHTAWPRPGFSIAFGPHATGNTDTAFKTRSIFMPHVVYWYIIRTGGALVESRYRRETLRSYAALYQCIFQQLMLTHGRAFSSFIVASTAIDGNIAHYIWQLEMRFETSHALLILCREAFEFTIYEAGLFLRVAVFRLAHYYIEPVIKGHRKSSLRMLPQRLYHLHRSYHILIFRYLSMLRRNYYTSLLLPRFIITEFIIYLAKCSLLKLDARDAALFRC